MAALGSQTIAASYEQLLHVDTDGGGATTTLVPVKDGDNDTTFCLQLSTTKAMIEGNASTLFFYDEGGEKISADNAGILSIAGGAEIDITTPTVDINASTAVTVDGPATTFASSTSAKPLVIIKNTTNDTTAPTLRFVMDKGSAGADGDDCGTIEFYGDDAGQNQTAFAKIVAEVSEADETDEAGKLSFYVAESDGTNTALTAGLVLEGEHATDGEIDVTIGAGAASTTTIAGDVTIPATKKLYLDAGGNTYLNEVAADTVTLVTGGTEAIRTRSDQSTITELYDAGNNTNAGVVRKVVRGVYTHDSADAIFTVTTVNESGSGDYGVYSCKVHAVIGQCVNCGAGAAVGWQGMWSHYNVDNAGATDAGLNENEETAPAGPNLSTTTISAVTGSVATTSATVTTFSLDATKGGSSPESTYKCVAMVELVYAGYLTPPTITAA